MWGVQGTCELPSDAIRRYYQQFWGETTCEYWITS